MDHDEFISKLEKEGIVSWEGIADDGDRILSFDLDKLELHYPALYEVIKEDIDNSIMDLYLKGLVELEYNENLEPSFRISPEGIKMMEELGFNPQ